MKSDVVNWLGGGVAATTRPGVDIVSIYRSSHTSLHGRLHGHRSLSLTIKYSK